MSQKSKRVLVLAYDQPRHSRIGTPMQPDDAEILILRLAAERISQKVIRMLPPDSEILAASHFNPTPRPYIPEKLPPAEVEGCFFEEPAADGPNSTNVPRMRNLPRFREVYGDAQVAASV